MNWEDERYVRLYTRDTITWKLIGWQGRCLLPLLLRKVDRAGCIELQGAGEEGIAALVDIPIEVVTAGLAKLVERSVVAIRGDVLVFPKYVEAHEARQSDKLRAKESRARRREQVMDGEIVTKRDASVTNRDETSRGVTPRHTSSHSVTLRVSEYQSINSENQRTREPENAPARAEPGESFLTPAFWAEFTKRCGEAWGLPAKSVARCAAVGFVVPEPEQNHLLHAAQKAEQDGYTRDELLRLADFVAAGGVSWRGAAWQQVAKNFLVELSKALAWDGVSDPRQRSPARAPRMMGEERHQEEARIADEQASDTAYIRAQLEEARADAAAREEEERQKRHGRRDE